MTDRKDLEKLLSPLKINCCKTAPQLPGGARSVPSPSLHQMPQIEHEIKFGSCGLLCLGTNDSDNPVGRIIYANGFVDEESS